MAPDGKALTEKFYFRGPVSSRGGFPLCYGISLDFKFYSYRIARDIKISK